MAWLDRPDARTGQPCLPFDDEETEPVDAEQPAVLREGGLADLRAEAALLAAALLAAEQAAASWAKVGALRRLLRRTREQVLVFTEYRDTLLPLATAISTEASVVTLHGGCSHAVRAAALAQFASGHVRVLLATDVAAEGVNLQQACRLVVHVELPWSPARIEQRNGNNPSDSGAASMCGACWAIPGTSRGSWPRSPAGLRAYARLASISGRWTRRWRHLRTSLPSPFRAWCCLRFKAMPIRSPRTSRGSGPWSRRACGRK